MNGRNSLFLLFPKGPAEVSSFPKKLSTSSLFESFLRYNVSLTVIIRNHWGDLTVIQIGSSQCENCTALFRNPTKMM